MSVQPQSRFTPGIWEAEDLEVYSSDCEAHPVADCTGNRSCRDEDECRANARLIAAAPEMLAALNAVRVVLKNRDQDEREAKLLEAISAIIGKAEGH